MSKRNSNLALLFVLSFILILTFSACNDNNKKETTIEQDKKTTMETQKMDTTHHLDTTVKPRPLKPGN
jgi:hypothetical protein